MYSLCFVQLIILFAAPIVLSLISGNLFKLAAVSFWYYSFLIASIFSANKVSQTNLFKTPDLNQNSFKAP